MGFKRRDFTGTLKVAILRLLDGTEGLSKKQLLDDLRKVPDVKVSVRRLTLALKRLLADQKIFMLGKRAGARFKRL